MTNQMFGEAFLRAHHLAESDAFSGMTADDLKRMSATEFARLTGQPTPAEAARAAFEAQYEAQHPAQATQPQGGPQSPPQPPAPEPQGIDIKNMTMDEYAALRGQLGVGGREYGRGIMNSEAGTDAWVAAAKAKSGRAAMNEHNVRQAPQLEGRTILRQDDMRDTRSAAERFSNPWHGR